MTQAVILSIVWSVQATPAQVWHLCCSRHDLLQPLCGQRCRPLPAKAPCKSISGLEGILICSFASKFVFCPGCWLQGHLCCCRQNSRATALWAVPLCLACEDPLRQQEQVRGGPSLLLPGFTDASWCRQRPTAVSKLLPAWPPQLLLAETPTASLWAVPLSLACQGSLHCKGWLNAAVRGLTSCSALASCTAVPPLLLPHDFCTATL